MDKKSYLYYNLFYKQGVGVPIWRRSSKNNICSRSPEDQPRYEHWRIELRNVCVRENPGSLSLVRNVLSCPPGGEGWPRNSKNENLSASRSANCNISHLVKAAAPLTCYPALRPSDTATQYFTQLEKLPIFWEKPKECTSGQVD